MHNAVPYISGELWQQATSQRKIGIGMPTTRKGYKQDEGNLLLQTLGSLFLLKPVCRQTHTHSARCDSHFGQAIEVETCRHQSRSEHICSALVAGVSGGRCRAVPYKGKPNWKHLVSCLVSLHLMHCKADSTEDFLPLSTQPLAARSPEILHAAVAVAKQSAATLHRLDTDAALQHFWPSDLVSSGCSDHA